MATDQTVEAFECEGHGTYVEVFVDGAFVATVSKDSALPEGTEFHSLEEWYAEMDAIDEASEEEFLRRPDGSIYGRRTR